MSKNEIFWENVERLAIEYAKAANKVERETIFEEVYQAMENYLNSAVNKAIQNVESFGLFIPREDFESRFLETLWKTIEAFCEVEDGISFRSMIVRRINLDEPYIWRKYRRKSGNSYDKDGYTYESARWVSLQLNVDEDSETVNSFGRGRDLTEAGEAGKSVSAEKEFFDNYEVEEILKDFAKSKSERYAKVIRFIYLGYEGESLAIVTGEADKYNSKMRKLVERAKRAFAEYMNERMGG